jgi:hypothetical protein
MTKKILILLTILLPLGLSGCQWLAYVFSPQQETKTVKPEFTGLENHTVAVVIFASQSVQYDYPAARLELSMLISTQLGGNIKKCTVVDPMRVNKYLDERFQWDSLPKTKIGKDLGADYVLFVTLVEYTLREPESANLFRGRIAAEAALYQTSLPEDRSRVWSCDDLRVTYPKENLNGVVAEDDSEVRFKSDLLLTQKLVWKFYKHEEKAE